ncbi:hypothetical protein JCM24511_05001 [Saitozyma sp. JCM 24511]|nr:hypothetical protein JCM24511_05001 [Saitozyma sp. JCM 24511]
MSVNLSVTDEKRWSSSSRSSNPFAGWITADYAVVKEGGLNGLDVQYVNMLMQEKADSMMEDVITAFIESGDDGTWTWVDTKLSAFADETIFWVDRGALLREASTRVLELMTRLLKIFHVWVLDADTLVGQVRRVRGKLVPETVFDDEYAFDLCEV